MAWSDAARQASIEARKAKAKISEDTGHRLGSSAHFAAKAEEYHNKVKKHVEAAKKATNDIDRKKHELAATVALKKVQNKAASAAKNARPGDADKSHVEKAQGHAKEAAEHHASMKSSTKAEASKSESKAEPKKQTTAERAAELSKKAVVSGKKEDHVAAAEAHRQAYNQDTSNKHHYEAQYAHQMAAQKAGTDKYDAVKAAKVLDHADAAVKHERESSKPDKSTTMKDNELNAFRHDYKQSLKPDEHKALLTYSGEAYTKINGGLRNPPPPPPEGIVPHMDSAIAKAKLPKDTVVHRGVGDPLAKQFKSMKPGDSFTDRGYMSTSAGNEAAFGDKPAIMHISLPKGHAAAPIPSKYPEEKELLLGRGTKLKVAKIEEKGGQTHIHLELAA